MVKRFQRSSQVRILTWVINILIEKLTSQIGDWIWKTPSAHYASGVGDLIESLSYFYKKLYWLPVLWFLGYRALLDLHIYGSDS